MKPKWLSFDELFILMIGMFAGLVVGLCVALLMNQPSAEIARQRDKVAKERDALHSLLERKNRELDILAEANRRAERTIQRLQTDDSVILTAADDSPEPKRRGVLVEYVEIIRTWTGIAVEEDSRPLQSLPVDR